MRCKSCDHLWPRARAPVDTFSLVVGHPAVAARPAPGRAPAAGPHRALRFEVQLPVKFRPVGETSWSRGTTVNISASGMFFRVERPVPGGSAVEILIELPVAEGGSGDVNLIRCNGHTTRSVPPVRPGAYASVGIAVTEYRVDGGAASE